MTHDEYGWVAQDRARRFWKENADGPVEDWRSFAVKHGMELVWRRLPYGVRGLRVGRVIILHNSLSESEEQSIVRHEMCHFFLHSCNMLWWQDQPYGELMISKYERQARELASLLGDT